MRHIIFTVTVCLFMASANGQKIKNIIFMIGDGMGLHQMYCGMTANHNRLNIESCTHTGLSKTCSADRYITDSAAGGTALATGTKTKNGMIGMSPDSVNVYSSMALAKARGLRTGLVVTSPITHATPASFYAHQVNRNMYEAIADDLLAFDMDVAIGGGRDHFEKREDKVCLTDKFRTRGYQIAYTEAELQAISEGKTLALLADVDMPVASQRGIMLSKSVDKALTLLSEENKKGFFLMVEGSQIDYQGHNNNADELILEMLDFDRAVGRAIAFAKEDGHTLVVITADHETGGLIILNGDMDKGTVETTFTTDNHTAVPVPVYAFGVGAERFTGIMQNTDICNKILAALKIKR
jgi:alkaline phosphatase